MFFFRVDSNKEIASGHVMRCLSIADSLRDYTSDIVFLTADKNPYEMIRSRGYEVQVLNSEWNNLMSELETVKQILKCLTESFPVLFIDTYQVTNDYVSQLKPYAKICYLGSKEEILNGLSLLINYGTDVNYDFYEKGYPKSSGTRLLLGATYAPLRKEFSGITPIFHENVSHILLTTGNTDKTLVSEKILETILSNDISNNAIIDVVLGSMYENKDAFRDKYKTNTRVVFHENVKNMCELMKQCDLAVSANGTTVYEMAAVGLPTISFAMVPEQYKSAKKMYELGIVDFCGCSYINENVCVKDIAQKVLLYCSSLDKRKTLAENAHSIINGDGCNKIVQALLELE